VRRRQNTLTIVIPALDEEEAIGDIVRRFLEAREHIIAESQVEDVEVVVVSDGSTDRTVEIARSFPETTVLVFEQRRGYGAAIKCGFEHGRGDLVGFLDADGTCDPLVFAPLCRAIRDQGADVALGSRMGPDSEMPRVRRLGNRIFSWLLGRLSSQEVGDTASGMRVVRADRLPDLYPLPDGLHFTPAMSARVLLGADLELVELPMPYSERVGRSKLSVVRDGVRFLRIIVETALCYRPRPLLLVVASILGLSALAAGVWPLWFWLAHGRIEEWMIYRVLLASLLATACALTACAAVVAQRISAVAYPGTPAAEPAGVVDTLFAGRVRLLGIVVLLAAAVAIVWPGIVDIVTTGQTQMHWSRAVLAALLVVLVGVVLLSSFLLDMLGLIWDRRADPQVIHQPDARHDSRSAAS
jgi:glycosyltransferase involved in cell wall biosynthesis